MHVDFGRTSSDYLKHRAGFPDAFFARLEREGVLRSGLRALDVGTGTGTVARGLAARGCAVIALDPAAPQLDAAREAAVRAGLSIDFRLGRAEETGLPTGSVDLYVAGQCWHWFEREAAAREAFRLVAPGGRLVIAHFDWLPTPGSVAEATEDLINAFNPGPLPQYVQWGHAAGIYPQWFHDVTAAGFQQLESFSFDAPTSYARAAWLGRVRASARVGASLPPEEVARFDAELARRLAERFPGETLSIPHRVFALIATRP
ncbi:class I SAM-dependent methyltransferase [Myxococcaceae bacterium JPH2]|nr:class I SAM-dependent methyltransferase [Myxococcaceae bacterium JPH2]